MPSTCQPSTFGEVSLTWKLLLVPISETFAEASLTRKLLLVPISGTFAEGNGTSVFDISINAAGIPSFVLGDINGDGHVTGMDLTYLLSAWGTADAAADINHDGIVGGLDLAVLLTNWGA